MLRFHDLLNDYPDAVIDVQYGKQEFIDTTSLVVTLTVTMNGVQYRKMGGERYEKIAALSPGEVANFFAETENALVREMKRQLDKASQVESRGISDD